MRDPDDHASGVRPPPPNGTVVRTVLCLDVFPLRAFRSRRFGPKFSETVTQRQAELHDSHEIPVGACAAGSEKTRRQPVDDPLVYADPSFRLRMLETSRTSSRLSGSMRSPRPRRHPALARGPCPGGRCPTCRQWAAPSPRWLRPEHPGRRWCTPRSPRRKDLFFAGSPDAPYRGRAG